MSFGSGPLLPVLEQRLVLLSGTPCQISESYQSPAHKGYNGSACVICTKILPQSTVGRVAFEAQQAPDSALPTNMNVYVKIKKVCSVALRNVDLSPLHKRRFLQRTELAGIEHPPVQISGEDG